MTPERWQQVKELFQAVLERPSEQRPIFLKEACAGDEALQKEVESLLIAHEQPDSFIDSPALGVAADLFQADQAGSMVGRRIGVYRLTALIGQGGMGAVYQAVRNDDQFQKQVAIKLVRRGMDMGFVLSRFRHERQILASLEHPHIARLLDGGTTEDGLPYLVMEYIEGQPITEYCDDNKLPLLERLKLFCMVCSAVQYAHQNLIIHRDLKPGNILVTSDGTPKLLDFGIAKLLNPEPSPEAMTMTMTSIRVLTPDYASPEQVRGESVTTATDVYSLGIILFELLTGQRPYRFQHYSPLEIERIICQTEIEKPSAVVGRQWSAEENNQQRTTDDGPRTIKKLRRQLSGDLDNIVLMAMRKEPERRYRSVEQFSEDIHRYLEGRPIIARKDTLGYRAGKFVRRNKWGIAAAAVVALSLMGGIVTATYQARRAERRFQQVRKLANTFLFEFHDKIQNLPGSTETRELVVKTALEYLDSLVGEAGSDPSLEWELASAYVKVGDVQGNPRASNLGHTQAAMESYRKALALMQKLAANDGANLQILRSLSTCYYKVGDLQVEAGDITGGIETLRQGINAAQTVSAQQTGDPQDLLLLIRVYQLLGDAQLKVRDADVALYSYRHALRASERMAQEFPNDSAQHYLASTLIRVGEALVETGDLMAAIDTFHRVLRIREALVKSSPFDPHYRREWRLVHTWLGNYSGGLDTFNLGDKKMASEYYRKALVIAEELAATDPKNALLQHDLAICYHKMGDITSDADRTKGAEFYRKALAINRTLLAGAPSEFRFLSRQAIYLRGLASPLQKLGDRQGALRSLRESLDILRVMYDMSPTNAEVHTGMHASFNALADVLLDMGDVSGALENYRQALMLAETAVTTHSSDLYARWHLADSYMRLGNLHAVNAANRRLPTAKRMKDWREARVWHQKGLAIWNDWSRYAVSTAFNTIRRDEATRAVAQCDAALAKLESHAPLNNGQ